MSIIGGFQSIVPENRHPKELHAAKNDLVKMTTTRHAAIFREGGSITYRSMVG